MLTGLMQETLSYGDKKVCHHFHHIHVIRNCPLEVWLLAIPV